MHRVVIIGGGFGGLYTARRLRRAPVELTLVDRRNHHLFQPLLYQVATGTLSPANIAAPLRALLKRQRNTIDFGDQIVLAVRLLREWPELLERLHARFGYVFLDEYQDTDVAQRANSRPNHSLSDGDVRYPAPDPGTRRA